MTSGGLGAGRREHQLLLISQLCYLLSFSLVFEHIQLEELGPEKSHEENLRLVFEPLQKYVFCVVLRDCMYVRDGVS
jgi:hypothetical protein